MGDPVDTVNRKILSALDGLWSASKYYLLIYIANNALPAPIDTPQFLCEEFDGEELEFDEVNDVGHVGEANTVYSDTNRITLDFMAGLRDGSNELDDDFGELVHQLGSDKLSNSNLFNVAESANADNDIALIPTEQSRSRREAYSFLYEHKAVRKTTNGRYYEWLHQNMELAIYEKKLSAEQLNVVAKLEEVANKCDEISRKYVGWVMPLITESDDDAYMSAIGLHNIERVILELRKILLYVSNIVATAKSKKVGLDDGVNSNSINNWEPSYISQWTQFDSSFPSTENLCRWDISHSHRAIYNSLSNFSILRVDNFRSDKCGMCGGTMNVSDNEAELVCGTCDGVVEVASTKYESKQSYGQQTQKSKSCITREMEHGYGWLDRLQATDSDDIPEDLIVKLAIRLNNDIRDHYAGLHRDLARLTCKRVREWIKSERKYSLYNSNVAKIRKILTARLGTPIMPPTLSSDERECVMSRFNMVMKAYNSLPEVVASINGKNKNMRYYPFFLMRIFNDLFHNDSRLPGLIEPVHKQKPVTHNRNCETWSKICIAMRRLTYDIPEYYGK